MGKHKDKKKESQLVIRVEKDEKAAFLSLCKALDSSAGREIRRFMREAVAAQAQTTTLTASPGTVTPEVAPAATEPEAQPVKMPTTEADNATAPVTTPVMAKDKPAKPKGTKKPVKTAE